MQPSEHMRRLLVRTASGIAEFMRERLDPYGRRPVPGVRLLSRMRFKDKINFGITSVVLFFGILTAVLVSRVAVVTLLEENRDRGRSMAVNMAARAVDPLLGKDFLRLKNLVDEIERLSDYTMYAFILDKQGDVLVHTFKGGFPVELLAANAPSGNAVHIQLLDTGEKRIYDFAAPVLVGDWIFGTVRLGISQARVQAVQRRVLTTIVAVTAGVAAVAVLLGSVFAHNVASRINALRQSAEDVVRGNLDVQTGPRLYRNCWEIQSCGLTQCPAFGDDRRRCWYLAGTMCPSCSTDAYPDKLQSCRDCDVFVENMGDEIQSLAETFDVMALALKTHLEELQLAQADIERQRQLMKTILDVTPDLVSLQGTDLVYKAVNKAFCTYFHLNECDIVGHTDFELFDEDTADGNYHEDKQILLSGRHMSKQAQLTAGDQKRWFHVIKVPVYDGGEIIGLLLTARDITIIKQYQERLIHSQKMQDLGKLAGGVAHEINTPLGIILGYVQLLIEDAPEGSQVGQDLKIIEKQTKVCKKIVADLLGFSRHIESSMEPMDLNASIMEVVSLVRHIFLQERVRIDTDFDPTVTPIVGDRDKLRQVWMNLLNNAFDAIGADGHILVGTKMCSHRRRVVVTVADTGKGISQKDITRIFDPFFTTKPAGEGTGLGLAVSFGIISDHKGRISAISPAPLDYLGSDEDKTLTAPPGPGTVFIVELPLTKEGLPDEECPEVTEAIAAGGGEHSVGGSSWQK
ncbi:PAS domain S-box-containing protein [Desulfobaculum xiamenense]|uniref:histidine kinase n=1 Tax=Desulfobaculum xiamenense TaxID=995050 RepID=A0A846QQ30_9BACT|nr:ATP-binding protein [Desulfobaculum xiamenense]NJB69090.1 PAS domain S-box-containing protein [Desulfobaculum xiamenense]